MRWVLAAGCAVASIAAVVALPTAPAAGRTPTCTGSRGTVVAVDFGHWGGPVLLGCGVGAGTGYQLLHDAGFTTAGTVHDGPGFICRLGDARFRNGTQFPTPQQDPCVVTPPESAYWSYWTAAKGSNRWSYDRMGAMSDVPVAGGIELWQFGAHGQRPTVTPNQLRTRDPTHAAPRANAPPPPDGSSGSPGPVIAVAAVVVLLGGGAGWTMWRRRRSQS